MSRHTFTGNRPTLRIVVGWDRPLCTFFAQVWDDADQDAEEPMLWVGCSLEEIETVDRLAEQVSPYGQIPTDILVHLRSDGDEVEFDCYSLRSRI